MSDLKLSASQVFKWLFENGYLEGAGEPSGNQLTHKFFLDASKDIDVSALPAVIITQQLPVKKEDWERKFIDLIMEAQVPARLEGTRGEVYYANKFSEAGLKVFMKAMQAGVVYEVLVKSVMLYYKSSVKFKKAVGNYFAHGDWRTDYEALMLSADQGREAITTHIENEIKPNDGERSNYTLG